MKYLKIKDVKSPEIGTPGSAGIDFFIPNDSKPIHCPVFEVTRIPLGLRVILPKGTVMIMNDKSGVANALGLHVVAGVIDSDYRGEIHACFINTTVNGVTLKPGDKIIQGIIFKYENEIQEVHEKDFEILSDNWGVNLRNSNGFGAGTDGDYRHTI